VDVTAYIRELLFGHDCVIVPGFGAFIGNYAPARIDENSGTFYPPFKQISFNRNLNHNDGLLAGRISASSGLNYTDARNVVEEFTGGIRRRLEKGERVVFDNIGSFANNQEGNLQFEPDKNANYLLDSYGLEPFHCQPVDGYDVRKRIAKHLEKDPVKQAATRKVLLRAAVIVPLLALIVAIPLKTDLFKSKVESTTMNPLVNAEFESNKSALDENNKSATEVRKEEATPKKEEATPAETVIPKTSALSSYVVITGSFKSRENADLQVSMLIQDGFTPEVVVSDNGFFRVCALVCNDIKTATEKKDSIIKKFPGTWVSRKK
jgi:hypothetical protein